MSPGRARLAVLDACASFIRAEWPWTELTSIVGLAATVRAAFALDTAVAVFIVLRARSTSRAFSRAVVGAFAGWAWPTIGRAGNGAKGVRNAVAAQILADRAGVWLKGPRRALDARGRLAGELVVSARRAVYALCVVQELPSGADFLGGRGENEEEDGYERE